MKWLLLVIICQPVFDGTSSVNQCDRQEMATFTDKADCERNSEQFSDNGYLTMCVEKDNNQQDEKQQ